MSVCERGSSYPQQSGSVTRLQPAAQQPRVCGPSPNGAQSQPGWPPRSLKHDTEPSTTVDILWVMISASLAMMNEYSYIVWTPFCSFVFNPGLLCT